MSESSNHENAPMANLIPLGGAFELEGMANVLPGR